MTWRKVKANRVGARLRKKILREAVRNRPGFPASGVGSEGVGADTTKHGKVIDVRAVIVGSERKQSAHVPLEVENRRIIDRDPCSSFHSAFDQGGVDAILQVIGVGEVIKSILDIGWLWTRATLQSNANTKRDSSFS